MRLASSALVLGVIAVTTSTTSAQEHGFALDRLQPSARGSEWFVLDSLDLRGHQRPAAGVIGHWAYKPLVAYDANGNERAAPIEHQLFVHPGASLVVWNRLRAAVDMPIALYQSGQPTTT